MQHLQKDQFPEAAAKPIASIIVCTKNSSARIGDCLGYIARIDRLAEAEVILVDNGSTDDTFKIMQSFAETCPAPCRVVQEFKRGNSAGRNTAIHQAKADILLFTDDDCYLSETFLTDWLDIFGSDEKLGFATGRINPYGNAGSMLGCNTSETLERYPAGVFVRRGTIQGSNMAFRKACLAQAGYFDALFGAGTRLAGEEWDVALRAVYRGWNGGYFPKPNVIHNHGRVEGGAYSHLLFYDFGAGAVYAKHLFTRYSAAILRKFAGELWRQRRDMSRLKAMASGFWHYQRNKHKGTQP